MNGAKRMYTVSGQEVSIRNNVQGYTITSYHCVIDEIEIKRILFELNKI